LLRFVTGEGYEECGLEVQSGRPFSPRKVDKNPIRGGQGRSALLRRLRWANIRPHRPGIATETNEAMEAADIAAAVLIVLLVLWLLTHMKNAAKRAAKVVKPPSRERDRVRPRYEWEPVTDRYRRQLKGVPRQAEDRDAILAFISSRDGVEAYIEPRTVMHPLSVVFVAGDGEWKRFELGDDRFVRELASQRRIPVFDASRTGYPERMRRRPPPPAETAPG
jgi:hypothetical protein